MRRAILFLVIFTIVTTFFACTSKAVPVEKTTSPVTLTQETRTDIKASWETEWKNIVDTGKKEGVVVIYGTSASYLQSLLREGFKKAYGIELEFVSGVPAQLGEKIIRERKAGLYNVDLYISGTTSTITILKPAGILDPLEPMLILPELTDAKEIAKLWRDGRLGWVDKDKTILTFLAYPSAPVLINTDLVRRDEIKSYRDLLNPKWKGKIVTFNPTTQGSPLKFFGVMGSKVLGYEYFRELAMQELRIVQDERLPVEWVARGSSAIALNPRPEVVDEFVRAGAHLEYLTPEEGSYLTSGGGSIAMFSNATHPYATRVFINWLLTKEGQTLFSRGFGAPSSRLDVPTEGFRPIQIPQPGVKYIEAETEEILLAQPEQAKLAKEIFGSLLK